MKIVKRILVDNQEYGLISDDVRLNLTRPGRATFRVRADKALSGLVLFDTGWSDSEPQRYFIGFVERQTKVSSNERILFCRELSAALNVDLPMGLRKVSVKDVLARIAKDTGLRFITPSITPSITQATDYMQTRSPYFHHVGGGYHALDAIGKVFRIPDFIWQQQGNGDIYTGSWNHSRWASRPVEIPDNLFTEHLALNCARIGMVPTLRPGVLFNRGIITAVRLQNEHMVLTWKKKSAAFS